MHDSDPTGIVAQKIEALRKPGGRSRAGHDNHLFSVTPCRYQNSLAYTAEGIPTEPQDDGARREVVEQDIGSTAVGDVAAGQQEAERATFAVGERVELAVAATSANPDRLDERPPFPPPAERCAFICVLSIRTSAGGPPAAASVTNISCQMPFAAHRTNRLYSVFLGP